MATRYYYMVIANTVKLYKDSLTFNTEKVFKAAGLRYWPDHLNWMVVSYYNMISDLITLCMVTPFFDFTFSLGFQELEKKEVEVKDSGDFLQWVV